MLGPYVGMNRVRAWVDGVTPVTFTVSAIGPCQRYIAHAYGGTSSGALTGSDCTFANGAFVDRYTLAVPSGVAAIRLDQRSTDFDAFLILYDSAGHPLGFDDDISTSSLDASLKILLPAGRYRLDATSAFGGETGSYSLTSGATPPEVDGCEGAFITRGVTTSQVVHETDCAIPAQAAGYYFSDQYGFFLATGQTATIRMHSSALDPYLVVYDLSAPEPTIEAEDDDGGGGTDAFVTIVAQRPSFFVVDASTALTNRVGAYTLTIR